MKTYLVTHPTSDMFILKIDSESPHLAMRRAREYIRGHRKTNPDTCLILGIDWRQESDIILQAQVEVHTVTG